MTLSVCCVTGDPGHQVFAALDPFRAVADEIVIAADDRTSADDLSWYAAVADQLYTIEFTHLERIQSWLHSRCSADWILRIDGDECASPRLIERLPEVIAQRTVSQFYLPRRWLFPDAAHWLEESPWWPDLANRLVRNDGALFFPGTLHTTALRVDPAGFLADPLYHLVTLQPRQSRQRRLTRYSAGHPELRLASGRPVNETYYLPEQAEPLRIAQVPDEDRSAIDSVLSGEPSQSPSRRAAVITHAPLSETDRFYAQRVFDAGGYSARITPFESDLRFVAGETRGVLFWIENTGTETWPWGLDRAPHIHLTYEAWDYPSRSWAESEVITPLAHTVSPGDRALMPITVVAPLAPGHHRLRVDLRHAAHRWFGCATEIDIEVH